MNLKYSKALLPWVILMPQVTYAALPVEREVERESSVIATGVYDRKPAGSVEYSKNGVTRRHFGPWIYDSERADGSGELIFLEDGSVIRRGSDSEYRKHPDGRQWCETVGSVTVCK